MVEDKGTMTLIQEGAVKWEVDAFTSLNMNQWYFSPNFSFAGEEWYLGIRRDFGEILLRLSRYGDGPTLDMEYTFSVKHKKGRKNKVRRSRMEFKSFYQSPMSSIVLEEKRMSEWVPDDTFTVLCCLRHIDPIQEAEAAQLKEELQQKTGELAEKQSELVRLRRLNEELNLKVTDLEADRDNAQKLLQTKSEDCDSGSSSLLQKNKVLRDYKDLFHKKETCDVILRVQGREFPAHRIILMARSPVFASTFQSDMKEKATGVVEIEDCDPSSFADFLCYLYCGALENLSPENVFDVFTAADKYDVQDLRSECLEFVKENLSVDTFCDTITLALRHSETELLHLATDFFTQNAPQIILTVKWQQFLNDNPTQSNELLIKLLAPNKKSNS